MVVFQRAFFKDKNDLRLNNQMDMFPKGN